MGCTARCATLTAASGPAWRRQRPGYEVNWRMPFVNGIGAPELIIILIIALIVVGPGKLPDVGAALGKSIKEFRKAATDVKEATSLEPTTAPAAPTQAAATAAPAVAAPAPAPTPAPAEPVAVGSEGDSTTPGA